MQDIFPIACYLKSKLPRSPFFILLIADCKTHLEPITSANFVCITTDFSPLLWYNRNINTLSLPPGNPKEEKKSCRI